MIIKCKECSNELQIVDIKCNKCGSLLEDFESINYLKLFEIEDIFNIDKEELHDNCIYLESKFHPDKYIEESKEEIESSNKLTLAINQAYKTISDSYEIYNYYYKNFFKEEDESQEKDIDFMMMMMEVQEDLEKNYTEEKYRIEENKYNKLILEFKKNIELKNKKKAKVILDKMKYYDSMLKRFKR